MDDLSRAILKAYQFNQDHLYMFGLTGRHYDPNGFYYSMTDGENKDNRLSLKKLRLKVNEEFLYFYDFVDDWHF